MTKDIEQQAETLRLSDPDLKDETGTSKSSICPFSGASKPATDENDYQFIPLRMSGRTHTVSEGSAALIEHEVSLEQLTKMTELFYEKAFQDDTLDKFIRSHDDPHGPRFAKWIHQKLSGSNVWDEDRRTRDRTPVEVAGSLLAVVHDRSSAHAAAWYSPKRPPQDIGRHFQLDECRTWMRLHFWAMREAGIVEASPSFADYYVRFIGHFVRVYESTAPMFARDSFRWSADPKNIEAYINNGRKMNDVLGVKFDRALGELSEAEANDFEWPYHQTQDQNPSEGW